MTPDGTLGRMLLLGTFHFTSKRNVINHHMDDMRSPRRQAQLDDLTVRLARYRPTKVIVERPYAKFAIDDPGPYLDDRSAAQ